MKRPKKENAEPRFRLTYSEAQQLRLAVVEILGELGELAFVEGVNREAEDLVSEKAGRDVLKATDRSAELVTFARDVLRVWRKHTPLAHKYRPWREGAKSSVLNISREDIANADLPCLVEDRVRAFQNGEATDEEVRRDLRRRGIRATREDVRTLNLNDEKEVYRFVAEALQVPQRGPSKVEKPAQHLAKARRVVRKHREKEEQLIAQHPGDRDKIVSLLAEFDKLEAETDKMYFETAQRLVDLNEAGRVGRLRRADGRHLYEKLNAGGAERILRAQIAQNAVSEWFLGAFTTLYFSGQDFPWFFLEPLWEQTVVAPYQEAIREAVERTKSTEPEVVLAAIPDEETRAVCRALQMGGLFTGSAELG